MEKKTNYIFKSKSKLKKDESLYKQTKKKLTIKSKQSYDCRVNILKIVQTNPTFPMVKWPENMPITVL